MMRLNHGKRLPYLSPQLFYGKKEYAEKNIKRTIKLKFSFSSRIQKKVVAEIKRWSVYSYFEKGCRKKCTRQSRKVLWVILRSLFFKESQNRMAWEAMDLCLQVLKESNKSRFDSYSVRNSVLIISHITFRDCQVHTFSDNLSRNSCI